MNKPELVIITGMSGAGKTVAMRSFEDLAYFTTDNLPAKMLPEYWQMLLTTKNVAKAAVVIDLRAEEFFSDLVQVVKAMMDENRQQQYNLRVIFLDATDEELVARYKETRRHHPLTQGAGTLIDIDNERRLLAEIKTLATEVIQTSTFGPRELRQYIVKHYGDSIAHSNLFQVQILSFGFKYGAPMDADLVIDVRFLSNPYYDPTLRDLTGIDAPVADYIWQSEGAELFYQKELDILQWALPRYRDEGRSTLTIAFGCTGGQHRSVAFAHRLTQDLSTFGPVSEYHRDMNRRKDNGVRV
ncbi:RNase adapter RapZ [Weissella diestrammenae]|uniref:RNase adapter RapZ n=1 Tax=Weissella diestrammenae TaxID=1162633 RepID=A0A7G9T3N5_9LACO|nr:RNase adapter RapZ [Weissella diestrammenae]MCM0582690.1 RNase adapter RapZ [Weissella diestrammenae]QNN74710.1 RNase adapter RapZ [Weissella diestrammenae]